MWVVLIGAIKLEGPSLFNLMLHLEKVLGHPVQVFHNEGSGKIHHAKSGDLLGEARKYP